MMTSFLPTSAIKMTSTCVLDKMEAVHTIIANCTSQRASDAVVAIYKLPTAHLYQAVYVLDTLERLRVGLFSL